MNGFDTIQPCPRFGCGGSVIPFTGQVETDRQNLWKCLSCSRVQGEEPPQTFSDEDVAADRTAARRIQNGVMDRSRRIRRYYG